MSENPYQSNDHSSSTQQQTSTARWLFRAGIAFLVVTGLCWVIYLLGLVRAYQAAAAVERTEQLKVVSEGVAAVLLPVGISVPCLALGIALLVTSYVVKEGESRSQRNLFAAFMVGTLIFTFLINPFVALAAAVYMFGLACICSALRNRNPGWISGLLLGSLVLIVATVFCMFTIGRLISAG